MVALKTAKITSIRNFLFDDILFVIYTERRDKIRLISARVAEESERRDYHEYGGKFGILHEESWRTVDGGGES